MIKIKLKDLQSVIDIFCRISQSRCNILLSYSLLKIVKALEEEAKIANAAYEKLKYKYGKQDENGNIVTKEKDGVTVLEFDNEDNKEQFLKEAQEFYDSEIEIACPKIKLSQLADENIKLSPVEFAAIESFIEMDIAI